MIFEDGVIKTPNKEFNENCGGIGNIFFNACKKYSERVAVINSSTDDYDTYSDLLKKCTAAALALRKRGLKKQDLVAICSNRENLHASLPIIAGQFLGCITFSIDPALTVDECSELLQQVQPDIIFVIEEAKQLILETFKACAIRSEIIIFNKQFEENFLKLEEIGETFKPLFIENLQETCMIHFSSGSTGRPKAICLSHYSLLGLFGTTGFSISSSIQKGKFRNRPMGAVSLRYSNWYWCSSSFEMIIYISFGGCRIVRDHFDQHEIWKLIEKYYITELFLTPLQCIELSRCLPPTNYNISSLFKIITGGYVLHKDFINVLRKMLPGVYICQVYGMTECGGTTSFNVDRPEHRQLLIEKPNSCGLPEEGLYFKVIDVNTGEKCGPNRPGELYLKGKKLFNGFYNRDSSTCFDEEGYFKTGDLVYFDEDFCFYILDRIKAVLGWNDWLIYPYHIEKVLLTHPLVYNAVVIGIPDKIEGERLMGAVMLKEDANNVTEDELVKYVEARVEDHKRLREGVKFVKYLPTTITGKVNRFKVKETILNKLSKEKIILNQNIH